VPSETPIPEHDPVLDIPVAGSASALFLQMVNKMNVKVEPAAPTRSSPEDISSDLERYVVEIEPAFHVKAEIDENMLFRECNWRFVGGWGAWYKGEGGSGDPEKVVRGQALRKMVLTEAVSIDARNC